MSLSLSPSPSLVHHHYWYITIIGTSPSLVHHHHWYITIIGTSPSLVHHHHWYITIIGTSPLLVHHHHWYITIIGTSPSLVHHITKKVDQLGLFFLTLDTINISYMIRILKNFLGNKIVFIVHIRSSLCALATGYIFPSLVKCIFKTFPMSE